MPIQDKHASYDSTQWSRLRAAAAGQRAVHNGAEAYLPRLSGQSDSEYKSYKGRAVYFNATGRTVDGLVGLVFRKEPVVSEIPTALDALVKDATLSGLSLSEVSRTILKEVLEVGRCGVLVEFPAVNEAPKSLAQAETMNIRPYLTMYQAESIINWKLARVNNVLKPVLIVLEESYEVPVDEWTSTVETQIRELSVTEGFYRQRVFRDFGAGYVVVDETIPMSNGKALTDIPFVFFGSESNSADVQPSPISDIVDINLSHYVATASYEHGCFFTGAPTPVVSGYQEVVGQSQTLSIGSSTAWVLPAPDAKAYYLEFTGQGLGAMEKNLTKKEAQMAAIGVRMLAPEKTGVESQGTVMMRHQGEQATLSSLSRLVSNGLTRALQIAAKWIGAEWKEANAFELSSDFTETGLTAQELTALVSAWQQGAISSATLFANLQRGEIIDNETSFEDEQASIADSAPTITAPVPASAALPA